MTRRPLQIGIVGAGYWGTHLSRTFGRLADARIAEICDLDPKLLDTAKQNHPDARTGTDLAAMLARPDVDAVVVATPPSRHHAMALAALRAGKHVWVEKPLALTADDARELVATATHAGRTLFVDETFLYDPLVREMRRLIDAGELGEVWHLSFERLGMGRIRRDSDVWWNSAPHDLSILFHLVPRPVVSVRLHLHTHVQPGVADVAACTLELVGGVTVHVHLSWIHPVKTATVLVVGRERMLCYEGRFEKRSLTLFDWAIDRDVPARACDGGSSVLPITKCEGRRLDVPLGVEPLGAAAEHFVACIREGREPLTSGARSLRVVETLEAADRTAVRSGRLA